MAQHESDREEMLREATALRRRVEFQLPERDEIAFAGFKSDEGFSVYFGAEPVYQFDGQNRLRRAFVGGFLYRTQGVTLARLQRERNSQATMLLRTDLTPAELQDFLETAHEKLCRLAAAVEFVNVRTVPAGEPVLDEVMERLGGICTRPLELAPAIRGKR